MSLTRQVALGLYPSQEAVQRAVHRLKLAGFTQETIKIVTPESSDPRPERDAIGKDSFSHAKVGGCIGAAIGIATGFLLLGNPGISAFFTFGQYGPVIIGFIIGGGVGTLIGSYVGLNRSVDEVKMYEERLKKGEALASVECSDAEHLQKAERILAETGAEKIYHRP